VSESGRVRASIFLRRDTRLDVFDRPRPMGDGRVVGIEIGDLSMHVGLSDDNEIIDVADRLADALLKLRIAAMERFPPDPRPDDSRDLAGTVCTAPGHDEGCPGRAGGEHLTTIEVERHKQPPYVVVTDRSPE
jgi:hypothetical protein